MSGSESAQFWDLFWQVRLRDMETLGKREAVLVISRLVQSMAGMGLPVRLLDLGCGEGHLLGALVDGHYNVPEIQGSLGVDYQESMLEKARRNYPGLAFIQADYTAAGFPERVGQFGLVMLVNTLHEVFSACYSDGLGEVDVPVGKQKVHLALANAVRVVEPGGYLVLFDGVEYPGDLERRITVRFQDLEALAGFRTFVREYRPFRIRFQELGRDGRVELSLHHFTRYITKSIFLGKTLWQTERLESYQYYNETEFRENIGELGLEILELRYLTVDYEKWHSRVAIETPGIDFPGEHILIVARRNG